MKKSISILFILLFILPASVVYSQEWVVPQDQKNIKNPSALTIANVKEGKALYITNCKSCHGDPGKYNALPLIPPPPDVMSEKMLANSDADIFYKINVGRVAMPAFENTLSTDQRWKIVNFMKSFDPANAGKLPTEEPLKAKLQASVNEANSIISVSAQVEDKTKEWIPLANATVLVKAKSAFGSIEIGTTTTNEKGYADYQFPKDYKGDKEGKIDLELMLTDEYSGNTVALNQAKIAATNAFEDLFKDKVLWSTNDKTQPWLIISYLGVVGGVWMAIGYIILLLFKLAKSGKKD